MALSRSHGGVPHMVAAAFFFSVMSLLVKLTGQSIPSQEIVLFRGVVTLILAWTAVRRLGLSMGGRRRGLLVLRGILGFAAVSCFFFAVVRLPLADVTVIHYTNPAFTAALAAVALAEPLRLREGVSIAVSLAGVILIARPSFLFGGEVALDPLGVAAGVLGAVLSAGAYVTVRELRHTEHHMQIVFWFALISTVGAVPASAAGFVVPGGLEWAGLLGVGVATHLGQVLLTRGLALEPAGRAMAVGYVQIVFAAVWGAAFFSEIPDEWTVAGAILIVISTLAVARRGRPISP